MRLNKSFTKPRDKDFDISEDENVVSFQFRQLQKQYEYIALENESLREKLGENVQMAETSTPVRLFIAGLMTLCVMLIILQPNIL